MFQGGRPVPLATLLLFAVLAACQKDAPVAPSLAATNQAGAAQALDVKESVEAYLSKMPPEQPQLGS